MNEEFKGDYLGFSFNDKHSSEFGIVRTSNGSRFEQKMIPTLKDKTIDKPNNDGQYYAGSTYSKKDIIVSFAFDNMNEEQYQLFRRWVTDKNIHRLVFDEDVTEGWYYMAKITGNATIKHIAFLEGSQRIYKGEGSITFSCLNPYKMKDERVIIDNNSVSIVNDGVIDILPIIKLDKPLKVDSKLIIEQDSMHASLSVPSLDLAQDEYKIIIDCENGLVRGAYADFTCTNNIYNDYYDGIFPSFARETTTSLRMYFDNSKEPVNATVEYTKFYL